jgi:hypothetical protein
LEGPTLIVMTAARRQSNGRPERSSTALTDFVLTLIRRRSKIQG